MYTQFIKNIQIAENEPNSPKSSLWKIKVNGTNLFPSP